MIDPGLLVINTDAGKSEISIVVDKPIIEDVKLVASDDPILQRPMPLFNFYSKTFDPIQLSNTMIDALKKFGGIGLSACQVGIEARMFVAGVDDDIVAFFNPEIIDQSKEDWLVKEGCLSFPNLQISIRRPIWIKVKYQDFNGNWKLGEYNGLTARVIQHEMDHLVGITFHKRAGPLALKNAKKSQKKLEKKR